MVRYRILTDDLGGQEPTSRLCAFFPARVLDLDVQPRLNPPFHLVSFRYCERTFVEWLHRMACEVFERASWCRGPVKQRENHFRRYDVPTGKDEGQNIMNRFFFAMLNASFLIVMGCGSQESEILKRITDASNRGTVIDLRPGRRRQVGSTVGLSTIYSEGNHQK
jgi:hypothetical protein